MKPRLVVVGNGMAGMRAVSVANMTLLLALFGNHPDTVSWGGLAHNLLWVTLGNAISGALFMGVA